MIARITSADSALCQQQREPAITDATREGQLSQNGYPGC